MESRPMMHENQGTFSCCIALILFCGLSLVPEPLHAQVRDTGMEQLLKERVEGFTARKKSGSNTLPVHYGADLEVYRQEMEGDPDYFQLLIRLYTDRWNIEPEEFNTFYIKSIQGFIRFRPGAYVSCGVPRLNSLYGVEDKRVSYKPPDFTIDEFTRDVWFGAAACNDPLCFRKDTATLLPFEFPAFNDHTTRLRALELIIPMKTRIPAEEMDLVIEKLVLSNFHDKSDAYGDPEVNDLIYNIVNRKRPSRETAEINGSVVRGPVYSDLVTGKPRMEWKLEASVSNEESKSNLKLILHHHSPERRYTGILSVEMILHSPDGSVLVHGLPEIGYEFSQFLPEKDLSPVMIKYELPERYDILYRSACSSLLKHSLFENPEEDQVIRYMDFLATIWKSESTTDHFHFPQYRSFRNYPISEGTASLKISIPASLDPQLQGSYRLHLNVSYLAGDSKTGLRLHNEILTFTDFLSF